MLPDTLVESVAEIITRYSMFSAGHRVGVAVSGGADSIVLLHLLHQLRDRFRLNLFLLHVNHQLRGAESDGDEAFVRSLGKVLDVPVTVEQAPVTEGNLEARARQKRRDFFGRYSAAHELDRVALGHTRSDQAETVLHHLLRGSGSTGLAAMRFVAEGRIARPLLTTSRQEVRSWAIEHGISWREDSSNSDFSFTRNRLRQCTLPALAADYNPRLETVLSTTATLLQTEEDYWTEQVSMIYSRIVKRTRLGLIFQVSDLESLHLAVARRLIRFALAQIRVNGVKELDFQHVQTILALCRSAEGHDRVLVPGADALRSFDSLLLSRPGTINAGPRHYQVELHPGQIQQLPFLAGQISIARANTRDEPYDSFKEAQRPDLETVELDSETLTGRGPLIVRNWEPGDQLIRAAWKTPEKVKRLFQEYRVRLWERRHWPILVCDGEVVWVRRFGAAEKFRSSKSSSGMLRLTYKEEESLQ